LAGLLVVLAAFAVHLSSDLFRDLESRFYDFASTRSSRVPSERIAVIAIDDQSIANIGRWPWPREVHAGLIDQLALAQAKTVAHTAFFFEPQTDRGLASLRELREQLDGNAPPAQAFDDLGEASRSHLLGFIAAAEQQLDSDARLASSLARAGNVILPSLYSLGEPQGRPDQPLPTFALQSALAESSGAGLPAIRSQQPLAAIGAAARGVAHLNQLADSDGAVRREPLLVNFDGHVIPSMGLMVAAHSLNLGPQDLRLLPGEAVLLGRTRIETDASGTVLPQFYPDRDGRPAFTVDSFYDVASGKIPAAKYAGKIVTHRCRRRFRPQSSWRTPRRAS
jgi:serine/threonine-protein kinase